MTSTDAVAHCQREHKKRHRQRQRERRQQALQEILHRIPPLSEEPSSSLHNVSDVFRPIPVLEDPERFWKQVPDMCNPLKTVMDSSLTRLDSRKLARDTKFQIKRQRKQQNKILNQLRQRPVYETDPETGRNLSRRSRLDQSMLSTPRGQRKAWQVENFVCLLEMLLFRTKKIHRVVDFGSGSGNLCLALAAYFRDIEFVLVDQNEYSLQIAQARAQASQLTNVVTQQFTFDPDNLADYRPPDGKSFDLGIGLHCCGSFTDMVLEVCLRHSQSNCIVCPCCNGGMTTMSYEGKTTSNKGWKYPRSKFMSQCLTEEEYLACLSKSADHNAMTEGKTSGEGGSTTSTSPGYAAKCWIEYDRALWAKEQGCRVEMWKMTPSNCTPKHHVLYIQQIGNEICTDGLQGNVNTV